MSGWQQGDHIGVDTEALQHLMNQLYCGLVRVVGICTTFQHAGVTTLEAEREDVEGDVRTSLVNHAYHSEGHTDTAEAQSVRQRFLFGDVS